jgi:citrate lyase subunit beta/citryl-CoA lyase
MRAMPPATRRSCLTVPASSEKMLVKAGSLAADEIVFDLEDSVAAPAKSAARERLTKLLADSAWRTRRVAVRINAIGSPWWQDDVSAIRAAGHPLLSLVVPKIETPATLAELDTRLAETQLRVQALIESAAGLAYAREIAASCGRLEALILGYADLAASLGRPADSAQSWQFAQETLLLAARAHGLQAIDGPFFAIADADGLALSADTARQVGFDGKWAIHPGQIAAINAAFTPSGAEIARARALVAALDAAAARGQGAVSFEGGMIDEAMRAAALRTLARAGSEA